MKTVFTKDTAEKNLEDGLQELALQIEQGDIITIAAIEKVDTATVRKYLKGTVAINALGKSILANGRAIVIKREMNAAYTKYQNPNSKIQISSTQFNREIKEPIFKKSNK